MKVLAIETASEHVEIGIGDTSGQWFSVAESGRRQHVESCARIISRVCSEAGVSLGALDLIVVDVGPGGYTGLRVGLVSAKAICFACDLPLLGLSSLAALAISADVHTSLVAPVVSIRRNEVNYALLHRQGERLPAQSNLDDYLARSPPGLASAAPRDLALTLAGLPEPCTVIGPGAPLVAEHLSEGATVAFPQGAAAPATTAALIALATLTPVERWQREDQVEPLYLSSYVDNSGSTK